MGQETVQIVKDTAKGVGAATFTTGSGYATYTNLVPVILGCVATLTGTVLSIVLIFKTIEEIRNLRQRRRKEKAEEDDIRYRQEHSLPCRRCTDEEIIDNEAKLE